MRTPMMRTYLSIALTVSLLAACNSGGDHQQGKTSAVNSSTESAESVSIRDTASGSVATKTDSSQNYSFTPSTDSLQIVGTENKYDIILPTDVLFDFYKSNLRPDGIALLEKVRKHFAQHGADQLHVWGHTDSKGSDQYNAVLSQKRAVALADWLKKQISVKGLIMAIGRGEKEPLVPNNNSDGSDNPVNRQKNRRVTLSVVKYPDTNKMLKQAKERAGKA
ncbi:OmpA family protein [Spirosoma validum]|uniref:OmpA family protein n=1 Tax=Spirosoma validum TaxID=2771355 RepID=A0A927AX74_9BACT|nr:OmpA family protein [Spirosoma validum]MBD2751441.1 OmpA family protein [Spirosoma validum]